MPWAGRLGGSQATVIVGTRTQGSFYGDIYSQPAGGPSGGFLSWCPFNKRGEEDIKLKLILRTWLAACLLGRSGEGYFCSLTQRPGFLTTRLHVQTQMSGLAGPFEVTETNSQPCAMILAGRFAAFQGWGALLL